MNKQSQLSLIKLLQQDGRQSYQALAGALQLHQSTIKRAVLKLIKDETIHITATVDPAQVGFPLEVAAMFNVQQDRIDQIFNELAKRSPVSMVSKVMGRFDIIALMRFSANEVVSGYYKDILANITGIKEIETSICLRNEKQRRILLDSTVINSPYKQLIGLLQKDGRQSCHSLAKIMAASPSTVHRNIQKMIEKGTIRISAVVDSTKIGFPLRVCFGLHISPERVGTVVKELAENPEILYISRTTGRYNAWASARFSSNEQLVEFEERIIAKVEGLGKSESFVCVETKHGPFYGGSAPG